jgi:hypothetical protein
MYDMDATQSFIQRAVSRMLTKKVQIQLMNISLPMDPMRGFIVAKIICLRGIS